MLPSRLNILLVSCCRQWQVSNLAYLCCGHDTIYFFVVVGSTILAFCGWICCVFLIFLEFQNRQKNLLEFHNFFSASWFLKVYSALDSGKLGRNVFHSRLWKQPWKQESFIKTFTLFSVMNIMQLNLSFNKKLLLHISYQAWLIVSISLLLSRCQLAFLWCVLCSVLNQALNWASCISCKNESSLFFCE